MDLFAQGTYEEKNVIAKAECFCTGEKDVRELIPELEKMRYETEELPS
ncbi:hypothetical protein [Lacrimispora sp.]|jgi:hypothetical protein|nr:hypothetical protein [Lacrimispora sp.]